MRKTYAYDFKIKICKIIVNKESSVGKIAKEYEISRPIISRWIAEYLHYRLKAFSGNGKIRNDKINTHFLEKRISELELENMILKKFEHFVKLKKK